MHPKYEEDFYGWSMATAALLKERKLTELDFENLIEEIESMGRSEKHQLANRLGVLMAHLLKWQYLPKLRGRSWQGTISGQRIEVQELIKDNPSLSTKVPESMKRGYKRALTIIEKETPLNLTLLPQECPYTIEQCLDDAYYPD
jgi:hypothetical protein